MTTLSMAHDQWHRMHGKYTTCDLDCGAGEVVGEVFEADYDATEGGVKGIRCGSCKDRHASVSMVKFCYEVKRDAETFERNEAIMAEDECEYGLSQVLCSGPGHYPVD